MNIAIVSTMMGDPWGGSEELWAAVAAEAASAGHKVRAFVIRPPSMPARLVQLQQTPGVEIRFRTGPIPRSAITRQLRKQLEWPWHDLVAGKPDVVLVSQSSTYACGMSRDYVPLRQKLRSLPYVVVCHGAWETFLPSESTANATIELFRNAHKVGFVSRRNIEIAERQIAATIPNAVVVGNPLNMKGNAAAPWLADETKRFACVSRLDVSVKNHDSLLEALYDRAWKERDWILDIFGDGNDRGYLQKLIQFYSLDQHVRLAGHSTDIRDVWANHHMLLIPSRTEALPLTLVEAMVCARPALVTNVGGVSEWIVEPTNGFIADGITASSIHAALERAWKMRDRWEEMGAAARDTAMQRIDPNPGATLLRMLKEATQ